MVVLKKILIILIFVNIFPMDEVDVAAIFSYHSFLEVSIQNCNDEVREFFISRKLALENRFPFLRPTVDSAQ